MANEIIVLSRCDAGQILEGIEVLIEQWNETAEFHRTGNIDSDVCIREATDANEAESIVATYRDIRNRIASQMQQAQSV